MPTPEIHEIKHTIIDRDVDKLKYDTENNTNRIIYLEKSESLLSLQMKSTMGSIDSLIGWIKWALGFAIVSYFSFFAWLLQQQLK